MRSPVKNHFHPRGNVYGLQKPKYPWITEILAWTGTALLIWLCWKLGR